MAIIRWVLHVLGLDHSPSLSILGHCPCRDCAGVRLPYGSYAEAFEAGFREGYRRG